MLENGKSIPDKSNIEQGKKWKYERNEKNRSGRKYYVQDCRKDKNLKMGSKAWSPFQNCPIYEIKSEV